MKCLNVKVIWVIRFCLILFIKYFIFSTTLNAEIHSDTLSFLHITDTHVIFDLPGYHSNIEKARNHFGAGVNPLSQFIMSANQKKKPDFMVITGDLVDFFDAETSDGRNKDTQIEQFVRLLELSSIPEYLTLGNHDISSDYAKADSYDTHQYNAGRARAAWIRNAPCFKDGTYYSRIFKVDSTTFRFIFLDNGYSPKESSTNNGFPVFLDNPQLDWLNNQLNISTRDVEIIFMHIPIPDSSKISSALLHSGSSAKNYNILSVLEKSSSACLLFVGHNHTNVINEFHLENNHRITQVQTAAFGYDPKNWRLIRLTADNVLISYPGTSDIQLVVNVK